MCALDHGLPVVGKIQLRISCS